MTANGKFWYREIRYGQTLTKLTSSASFGIADSYLFVETHCLPLKFSEKTTIAGAPSYW